MDICREKDALHISDLDPFLAELLRQIPASTNLEGAPAAEQRIFSAPVADPKQKKVCDEWKTYVQPELRRLFQSSTEIVTSDLAQLNGNEKSLRNCSLRIPLEHADA